MRSREGQADEGNRVTRFGWKKFWEKNSE